jgi:catechol 2,3-dioxygenase-like lactoylglutathione lyase family enzyme
MPIEFTDQAAGSPDLAGAQVNLFCADVERCAAFFEALGMPRVFVSPDAAAPDKIEVDAAGFRIGFDSVRAANRIADLGVEAGGARSAEVALWVRDVDALYERGLRAGGTSVRAPMDAPDGRLRYAWLLDPEGHQVRLLQKGAA